MESVFCFAWNLALNDLQLRYKRSRLGFGWIMLKPLLLFLILYLVFSYFIRTAQPGYALYLLLGILLWGFFSEGTVRGMQVFLQKAHVFKKVALRPDVLVFACVFEEFLSLIPVLF